MHASVKFSLSAIIALALATPAVAQDARKPTSGASSTGGTATSRGGGSSAGSSGSTSSGGSTVSGGSIRGGTAVSRPAPSREPQSSARRRSGAQASGGGPAIPAYSRPRGDRAVRGTAVERTTPRPGPITGGDVFYLPYYGYNNFYGYNSFYGSRYGFGYPFYMGLGYFYYDPFWGYHDPYYGYGSGGYGRGSRDDRDYDIGSLRLKVDPSHAEVFVDGLYRGVVDDFDGVFQRLKLEAGAHRLEVRAPGFKPLVFDVLVTPGETTTYRGDLQR
ncbi:MAG: PEGA domain-containing protein [Vicinamibacterales bacterium]